ncbi:MAG: methyltransferase domain-containing protein [Rhodobacteraceae bacterium]|nr:methyltransferase domain-containing protein [Paracoccaceae bacterium]
MPLIAGQCPVCGAQEGFVSDGGGHRDGLLCCACGSLPRERAFLRALELLCPGWRGLDLHECAPAGRALSRRLAAECPGYVPSQLFRDIPRGSTAAGPRCEDLEALTFPDASLDLHCHLDVMEHVNRPDRAMAEMARTLRPGGLVLFTTPVHAHLATSRRRAILFPDGVEHLAPPEIHGNPVDPAGALVTFHYGQDLPDLIRAWVPAFEVLRLELLDARAGILGAHRDVFALRLQEGGPWAG